MKQPSFTPEIDNCTLLFDLFPVHISRYLQKHYENKTEKLNGEFWKTNISKLI